MRGQRSAKKAMCCRCNRKNASLKKRSDWKCVVHFFVTLHGVNLSKIEKILSRYRIQDFSIAKIQCKIWRLSILSVSLATLQCYLTNVGITLYQFGQEKSQHVNAFFAESNECGQTRTFINALNFQNATMQKYFWCDQYSQRIFQKVLPALPVFF